MGKFVVFLLGALLGLVIGGLLTFYLFVGTPSASKAPGQPVQPPDPGGNPPGTAQVILPQEFFNNILQTIFRDMNAPAFQLGLMQKEETENPNVVKYGLLQNGGCEDKIVLLPEGSGIQTGIRFEENKIAAPLAFSGSKSIMGNCIPFSGWAQAYLELRFDQPQQTVFGQINVETVNLEGVNPIFTGLVTPFVQTTLNSRVNPIEVLRGQQIALSVPIAATDGQLQAAVQDVRAEVKNNALHLYIIYDFKGVKANQ
ncbi:MAG TPA: hypothetical protein VK892_08835 [Pyrinomonadaceae bacterium]|nr:hypothetical protein [Pyrinomonadaceae bacterium]